MTLKDTISGGRGHRRPMVLDRCLSHTIVTWKQPQPQTLGSRPVINLIISPTFSVPASPRREQILGLRRTANAGCGTTSSLQLRPHCVILLNRTSDVRHNYKLELPIESRTNSREFVSKVTFLFNFINASNSFMECWIPLTR